MKTIFIFVLLLLSVTLFNVGLDFLLGDSLKDAIRDIMNPFWLMQGLEYTVLFLIVLIMFLMIFKQNLNNLFMNSKEKRK